MSFKKTVCLDLDGTLAEYQGWQGLEHIGQPLPGAVEFVRKVREKARVVIFTTRTKVDMDDRPEGVTRAGLAAIVQSWLDKHGFVVDEVYTGQGKPIAAVYVDDRAVWVPSNPASYHFESALLQVEEMLKR